MGLFQMLIPYFFATRIWKNATKILKLVANFRLDFFLISSPGHVGMANASPHP